MSGKAKILWAVLLFGIAGLAILSEYIPATEDGVSFDAHTTNAGELTVDTLVGQTFTARQDGLKGVKVLFATYSGRDNTEPVKFHLRSSIRSNEDIRTGEVSPTALGDNQFYTFTFEPIPDSANQQYFFFVVSPTSAPGNAVTVDLDTRDPYHLGSAYVVRGQGSAVTNETVLERSGKPTQDVSFGLEYEVSLRKAVIDRSISLARAFVSGWTTDRAKYLAYGWGLVAAISIIAVVALVQQTLYSRAADFLGKREVTILVLLVLMVLGLVLRIRYASELPVTNDEGNYLYDAWSARQGILAGGDGYVKAPLFIAWVALWQSFFGDTVLAGRLSSIVASVLTTVPIYFLALNLWSSRAITHFWLSDDAQKVSPANQYRWGRRVGMVTAALWALLGGSVVSSIYVHTQPLSLLFAVSGLAVLLAALRGATPSTALRVAPDVASGSGWFILSGVLLGLGVASRKSVLAVGLVPLLFILLEGKTWQARMKHLFAVGFGFLLVMGLFLGTAYYGYGTQGVWEAIGINSADDGINAVDPAEAEQVRAYSIRGMTPFFRENLPLILLSVLGLGFSLEYALRMMLKKIPDIPWPEVFSRIVWVFAWGVFAWAWKFFFEYEGAPFMKYGISELWWVFGGILLLATIWPDSLRHKNVPEKQELLTPTSSQPGFRGNQAGVLVRREDQVLSVPRHITAALAVPLWMGGLVFFYMNWIKFHANYISEFLPPLIVLSGFGLVAFFHRFATSPLWKKDHFFLNGIRRLVIFFSLMTVGFAITVSGYITYFFEHTGTFHQGPVERAALWAEENIPLTDSIFTGAALIPYLSGHHVTLDIAHPRWYAYQFTRENTDRLNTFLPPAEDMVQAYREATWFLLEQQTGFSFLMEYSEIEAGLATDWEKVHEIENGGNPLSFYRRVK